VQEHLRTDIPAFRLAPQQEHLFRHGAPTTVSICASFVDPSLDEPRLRSAIQALVDAHEILRTTFVHQAGLAVPRQAVHEELALDWEVRELTTDSTALDGVLREEAGRAFDLENGPALRALLLDRPDGKRVLVLSASAACLDRASLLLLVRELAEARAAEPLQYADYAEWRAEILSGDDAEAEQGRRYWSDATAAPAASPVVLFGSPTDAPRTSERVTL
jgi:hypothetical protein